MVFQLPAFSGNFIAAVGKKRSEFSGRFLETAYPHGASRQNDNSTKFFVGLCGFAALRENYYHAKTQRRKETCFLEISSFLELVFKN